MRTAVIILGHGSRHAGAAEPLAELAAAVRMRRGYDVVEHAFLQYVPPTLPDTVGRCVAAGAERIVIVPFFVQAGAHVAKDIPALVEELKRKHPAVRLSMTGHVGGHPLMVKVVEELVEKSRA